MICPLAIQLINDKLSFSFYFKSKEQLKLYNLKIFVLAVRPFHSHFPYNNNIYMIATWHRSI